MKLQLDLDNKVIRLDDNVNLSDLFETLKKLLPQGEWKEFSIETNTTLVWSNPIVYPYYAPTYPIQPLPWIVTTGTSVDVNAYTLATGTFNIDVVK
jgi:transposase